MPSAGMHMWPCVHGHGRRTYHDTTLKQNRAPTALVPLRGRPWMLIVHCPYWSNTPPPPFNPAQGAPAESMAHRSAKSTPDGPSTHFALGQAGRAGSLRVGQAEPELER